jgi:threonine dehydrogenase-like Zn-dependent dehydrogenase
MPRLRGSVNPVTGKVVLAAGYASRTINHQLSVLFGFASLFRHNIRLAGGPAPVRAYIEELMPAILDGTIEPGKVFDAVTDLDGVPAGYRDMDERRTLKVLIRP